MGGPPSGSDQVVRSTKHVLLAFQSSLIMACPKYLTNAFARQKHCFQKRKTHRHYTHNAFIAFGYKKRLPLYKHSVPKHSGCANDYKPRTFNKIDVQENVIGHQVNTFQMCPDRVLIQSISTPIKNAVTYLKPANI